MPECQNVIFFSVTVMEINFLLANGQLSWRGTGQQRGREEESGRDLGMLISGQMTRGLE